MAVLIDLPEFGGLAEWQEALAELLTLDGDDPEVKEAIARCHEEIAELSPGGQLTMAEKWKENSFIVTDD